MEENNQEKEIEEQEIVEEVDSESEEDITTEESQEVLKKEAITEKKVTADKTTKEKPSKKQKLAIIISAIVLLLVIIGVVLFLLVGKSDKKKETPSSNTNSNDNPENAISHQEIINQYGAKLDELVENYTKQNGKSPELSGLLEYAKVGDYKISCKEQKITSNKKVYLGECTVNGSQEVYSYGEKEEVKTSGQSLTVYKGDYGYGTAYTFDISDEEKGKFQKVGTIPCEFDNCEGYNAFDQYAIIRERKESKNDYEEVWDYYFYDYKNNKYLDYKVLNPDEFEDLEYNNKLYGVFYEKSKESYIYNLSTKKTLKVESDFYPNMSWNDSSAFLPLGYVVLENENGVTDFINFKTGKVIYSINNVYSYRVDGNKVYTLQSIEKNTEETYNSTYKVYDSKGYLLFDGEDFDGFYVNNNIYVTWKNGEFKTYDANFQVTFTKKYTDVMDVWEDYALVIDDKNINFVDYKGNLLATFITDWNESEYMYHPMLSGWYTENGKNGIYLVIQGGNVSKDEILKNNPDMDEEELEYYDLGYEYYYIPSTKESGKIPTYIGGYAKPVLYLYPMFPTFINVTFKYPEKLTTTYPKYKDKWTVFANPNGDLRDLENKYYYGLYWEENLNHRVDFKEGFYVTKENAIEFLEEKLSIIGFNDRERNEFIMYWLPILEKNGKNLVYFELTEERDSNSPITISPKPNSMLRVAIHVKKVEKETKIKEQKLPTFERIGFTAVEWGGVTY